MPGVHLDLHRSGQIIPGDEQGRPLAEKAQPARQFFKEMTESENRRKEDARLRGDSFTVTLISGEVESSVQEIEKLSPEARAENLRRATAGIETTLSTGKKKRRRRRKKRKSRDSVEKPIVATSSVKWI